MKVEGVAVVSPAILHDIEETAIRNLNENMAGIIAKKVIAGTIAKEAAARGIREATDSPLLGLAAKVFFYASDQADLRSWNLLPRDLQVLRVPLQPGLHTVQLLPQGGGIVMQPLEKTVQVEAGKKSFVVFRVLPNR